MAELDHERVLAQILAHTTAQIELSDPQGCLIHVNRRFTELTGYTADEALGRTSAELLRCDVHDAAFYEAMGSTVRAKQVWQGELVSEVKDGSRHRMLTTVIPVLDAEGSITQILALREPITAGQTEAEDHEDLAAAMTRLRASEQRCRTMVEATRDAILVADFDSALMLDANPAACEILGYTVPEFRQLTGRMLTAPEDRPKTEALSHDLNERGHAYAPRLRAVRKDGSKFWAALRMAAFELGGRKLYVTSLRDVTEQVEREAALAESNERLKAAQERLRRSERLAALGQLSAAVAHEINNPLQFVDTNLAQLQRSLRHRGLPEELTSMLDDLRDGVDRIANITRDLASFTRIDREDIEPVDLNEIVRRACRMLKNEIRHRARLELRLEASRPLPADRGKLAQLVTNLLVNASQAIVEGHADVNRIVVRTQDTDEALLLTVQDTGKGMPRELLARIFEPFFTTKPTGQGGGLGLPVCAEIVRLHEGTIEVRSEPDRGSAFLVRLPFDNGLVAAPPPSPPTSKPAMPSPPRDSPSRILIIDDEALVLRGMKRLLSSKHEVVIAQGGKEGLRIIDEDPAFDVVLCDLMMPVLDGPELHQEILLRAPALVDRMIFYSGGAFTPRVQDFIGSMANPLLKKPVRADALFEAVEQVIARTAASPS
ncbi:MAG: PAS domain S-box protein [Myxococcota bacterium]